jgi:hypothetical protein
MSHANLMKSKSFVVNIVSISFLLVLLSSTLKAQPLNDPQLSSAFEYTQRVRQEIEELNKLTPDKFLNEVDKVRTSMERYFDHKKRVCNGEFSTVILSVAGERSTEANRLTADEKKLCFREMRALQTTYINNMYGARKRYLENLHIKRMEDLETSREKALQELSDTFSRIRM